VVVIAEVPFLVLAEAPAIPATEESTKHRKTISKALKRKLKDGYHRSIYWRLRRVIACDRRDNTEQLPHE
jgi:hypothetical protein